MKSYKRPGLRALLASSLALAFIVPTAWGHDDGAVAVGKRLAAGTGYPSLVRLMHQHDRAANGRVLMVFEQSGLAGVPLWRSDDDGTHWRLQQNVIDQKKHADSLHWQLRWQPNLTEMARASSSLKPGTLLLAANATGDNDQGRLVAEDLQLYASTDQGQHWQYRGSIVTGGGNPSDEDNKGVWEPNVHILDDGRMVAYYSSEQHKAEGYNQLLAHKLSSDGGKTWGPEKVDVAIPGGVERPGMAVVARMPDGRYAMTYENIDGPKSGQVFMKLSDDGLDFGNPHEHGAPVLTLADGWPSACPTVQWLPLGEDPGHGILTVLAERAGGGADEDGRSLWWNADNGRGPWWRMPAPVQKRTGNIHAGWTQALMVKKDGSLLHVTSSSDAASPEDVSRNEILFNSSRLTFDRYEAEDAGRHDAVQIDDATASLRGKARVASAPGGALDFRVHLLRDGQRHVSLRWQDIGLPTQPVIMLDGKPLAIAEDHVDADGWHLATADTLMPRGDHTLVIKGGAHAMDVDYLELTPLAQPAQKASAQ